MRWQQGVADITFEVNSDGSLKYRQVVLVVPRQQGKTALSLPVMVHRATCFGVAQQINYMAQSGKDARSMWFDEHWRLICNSDFRFLCSIRKASGREAFLWVNGSRHSPLANTETAAHGTQTDLAVIDEAFAQKDSRMETGLEPGTITRWSPQLWVISTAGENAVKSPYLWGKVEAGRRLVESGEDSSTAYFEFSADPDDDPGSEDTWFGCMPALGHTVDVGTMRAIYDRHLLEGKLDEFKRSYLNVWGSVKGKSEARVFDEVEWNRCEDFDSVIDGVFAVGVDVSPSRASAAVVVAGKDAAGCLSVAVVEFKPGVDWVQDLIVKLSRNSDCLAVMVDERFGLDLDEDELDCELINLGWKDVAIGCGRFYDYVKAGTVKHRGQDGLTEAVLGASERKLGDGFAFNKRGDVQITCLMAAVFAVRAFELNDDVDGFVY